MPESRRREWAKEKLALVGDGHIEYARSHHGARGCIQGYGDHLTRRVASVIRTVPPARRADRPVPVRHTNTRFLR